MHSVTAIGTDHNTCPSHIHLEPSTSAREKEERRNGGVCESTETHKTPSEEKTMAYKEKPKLTIIDKRERVYVGPAAQTWKAQKDRTPNNALRCLRQRQTK